MNYTHLGYFIIYIFMSWLFLMLVFKLLTYYKYFFHIVPFVIGYAVLTSFLLNYFNFQDYFWWYLILSSFFFFMNVRKHFKSKDAIDAFALLQKSAVESIQEDEIKQQVKKELSPNRTIKQHVISSLAIFIISFFLAFYLFNGGL